MFVLFVFGVCLFLFVLSGVGFPGWFVFVVCWDLVSFVGLLCVLLRMRLFHVVWVVGLHVCVLNVSLLLLVWSGCVVGVAVLALFSWNWWCVVFVCIRFCCLFV